MGLRTLPILLLVAAAASSSLAAGAPADAVAEIQALIAAYERAFVAKDLERLASFYHPT
jgi:hypothetical protein